MIPDEFTELNKNKTPLFSQKMAVFVGLFLKSRDKDSFQNIGFEFKTIKYASRGCINTV